MKPYRERMEQEAARLRAALRRLETTSGQHRAVAPDFQGIRRAHGAWVTVRRFDQARYDTLARELRAVEARLAAALAAPPGRRLVVLVGCVATKRPAELYERGITRRWPAVDVYTSPLGTGHLAGGVALPEDLRSR